MFANQNVHAFVEQCKASRSSKIHEKREFDYKHMIYYNYKKHCRIPVVNPAHGVNLKPPKRSNKPTTTQSECRKSIAPAK